MIPGVTDDRDMRKAGNSMLSVQFDDDVVDDDIIEVIEIQKLKGQSLHNIIFQA